MAPHVPDSDSWAPQSRDQFSPCSYDGMFLELEMMSKTRGKAGSWERGQLGHSIDSAP